MCMCLLEWACVRMYFAVFSSSYFVLLFLNFPLSGNFLFVLWSNPSLSFRTDQCQVCTSRLSERTPCWNWPSLWGCCTEFLHWIWESTGICSNLRPPFLHFKKLLHFILLHPTIWISLELTYLTLWIRLHLLLYV